MQALFDFYALLSKLPIVIACIVLFWLAFKLARAFYYEAMVNNEGGLFARLIAFFDPYRQSFFFFKYNFVNISLLLLFITLLSMHYVNPVVTEDGYLQYNLFHNPLTGLPGYLVHEFSHRFWCVFGSGWVCYASGNGAEIILPLITYFFFLRLRGGGYLLPFAMFWLAVSFYGAGVYASDARASAMALTSSDMVSNFAAGQMKGDWHYILGPLGLLERDVLIGNIFIVLACFCLVMGIYGFYHYIVKYDHAAR